MEDVLPIDPLIFKEEDEKQIITELLQELKEQWRNFVTQLLQNKKFSKQILALFDTINKGKGFDQLQKGDFAKSSRFHKEFVLAIFQRYLRKLSSEQQLNNHTIQNITGFHFSEQLLKIKQIEDSIDKQPNFKAKIEKFIKYFDYQRCLSIYLADKFCQKNESTTQIRRMFQKSNSPPENNKNYKGGNENKQSPTKTQSKQQLDQLKNKLKHFQAQYEKNIINIQQKLPRLLQFRQKQYPNSSLAQAFNGCVYSKQKSHYKNLVQKFDECERNLVFTKTRINNITIQLQSRQYQNQQKQIKIDTPEDLEIKELNGKFAQIQQILQQKHKELRKRQQQLNNYVGIHSKRYPRDYIQKSQNYLNITKQINRLISEQDKYLAQQQEIKQRILQCQEKKSQNKNLYNKAQIQKQSQKGDSNRNRNEEVQGIPHPEASIDSRRNTQIQSISPELTNITIEELNRHYQYKLLQYNKTLQSYKLFQKQHPQDPKNQQHQNIMNEKYNQLIALQKKKQQMQQKNIKNPSLLDKVSSSKDGNNKQQDKMNRQLQIIRNSKNQVNNKIRDKQIQLQQAKISKNNLAQTSISIQPNVTAISKEIQLMKKQLQVLEKRQKVLLGNLNNQPIDSNNKTPDNGNNQIKGVNPKIKSMVVKQPTTAENLNQNMAQNSQQHQQPAVQKMQTNVQNNHPSF